MHPMFGGVHKRDLVMHYEPKTGNKLPPGNGEVTNILYTISYRLRSYPLINVMQSKSFKLKPPKLLALLSHRNNIILR